MKTAFAFAGDIVRVVESGDRRVMLRVNRWQPPRWVRVWMVYSTRGGDGWAWYLLGVLILLFGGPERWVALAAAMAAVGAGIGLFLWLKKRIGRQRPCAIEPQSWHTLLPPDQFSFPSGHTITAFTVAVSVVHFYPAIAPVLWFCALSVAASRVVLGMHFLSDVMAGAGLGGLLGCGSFWVAGLLSR